MCSVVFVEPLLETVRGLFFFFKRKQLKQYQLTKINELIFPIDSDSSVSLKFGCFFSSKSEITLIETSQGKHIQDCTEKPLLRETQVGIILFNFHGTGLKMIYHYQLL